MDRDLCMDLCVTVWRFLSDGLGTIDTGILREWLTKNGGSMIADALFADDTILRAAVGYDNFCNDACKIFSTSILS